MDMNADDRLDLSTLQTNGELLAQKEQLTGSFMSLAIRGAWSISVVVMLLVASVLAAEFASHFRAPAEWQGGKEESDTLFLLGVTGMRPSLDDIHDNDILE